MIDIKVTGYDSYLYTLAFTFWLFGLSSSIICWILSTPVTFFGEDREIPINTSPIIPFLKPSRPFLMAHLGNSQTKMLRVLLIQISLHNLQYEKNTFHVSKKISVQNQTHSLMLVSHLPKACIPCYCLSLFTLDRGASQSIFLHVLVSPVAGLFHCVCRDQLIYYFKFHRKNEFSDFSVSHSADRFCCLRPAWRHISSSNSVSSRSS